MTDADRWLDKLPRQRDWGEINSMPSDEHMENYPQNALIKRIDALYWRPPAGESIADVRLRVRNFFDTLHRECEGKRVIVVTHGEFMSAARAGLEYLSDEEWVMRESNEEYKLYNTHMLHYSRIDPANGDPGNYVSWLRSVCVDKGFDSGWISIIRHGFSNKDPFELVGLIPPVVALAY